MSLQKIWVVEYEDGKHRAFRKKDNAYKLEFEINYNFFKKELEEQIIFYEKCKDPEYAKSVWHEPVTGNEEIGRCRRALEHLERVKNANMSWQKKTNKFGMTL